ncbi:MAG: YfhO family protein, partial [Chloroflexota bacterium]
RNLDFLPRAFLVHRAHVVSGAEEALEGIRGGGQREVVLSDYTGPVPAPGEPTASLQGENVEVALWKPGQIKVKANVASPGFLVLSETFYPGWRATVNGSEVPIVRANLLFKAVYLPVGEHTVEFLYYPDSFVQGVIVSIASLSLVVVVLAVWRLTTGTAIR